MAPDARPLEFHGRYPRQKKEFIFYILAGFGVLIVGALQYGRAEDLWFRFIGGFLMILGIFLMSHVVRWRFWPPSTTVTISDEELVHRAGYNTLSVPVSNIFEIGQYDSDPSLFRLGYIGGGKMVMWPFSTEEFPQDVLQQMFNAIVEWLIQKRVSIGISDPLGWLIRADPAQFRIDSLEDARARLERVVTMLLDIDSNDVSKLVVEKFGEAQFSSQLDLDNEIYRMLIDRETGVIHLPDEDQSVATRTESSLRIQ